MKPDEDQLQSQIADLSSKIVLKTVQSAGFKRVILSVFLGVVQDWSEGSRIKKGFSRYLTRIISKVLAKGEKEIPTGQILESS